MPTRRDLLRRLAEQAPPDGDLEALGRYAAERQQLIDEAALLGDHSPPTRREPRVRA